MAIDPRKLRPSQLVQLLNSTPLGEVANERTLYRHRARAGLRIGDGKTVDPFYLKIIKPDTLVIIDKSFKRQPRKRPSGQRKKQLRR